MMPPMFGVPEVRRGLTETSGRDMFPRNPTDSTVVFVTFDGTGTFGSGSRLGDFGTGSDEMAGMCVNISTEFQDCVRPVDPLFDLLRVVWSTVGNKRNNTLCSGWLSCWDKLNLGVMNRYETMGQCSGAPGGYIPPGRAALLFRSDHAEIKGFWDCAVVGCLVQVIPLLRLVSLNNIY